MKLKIEAPQVIGRGTRVWIDGVERHDIVGIDIAMHVLSLNRVTIEFLADEIELEGEFFAPDRPEDGA